jgi:hypothetical protein
MVIPGLVLLSVLPLRQATPVSLDLPASRMPAILDALGKQTGETYEVAPEMQNEIAIVRSTSLTAEQLRTHLGKAVAGRWDRTAIGFRLVPDAAARNAQRLGELQTQAQQLRKFLSAKANPPKAPKSDEAEMASALAGVFSGMGGGDREIAQLLLGVDLTRIVRLEAHQRVVFSTRPNSLQLPLPAEAPALINRYVLGHNTRVQRVSPDATADTIGAVAEMLPAALRDMMKARTKPIGDVARATLSINQQDIIGGYQATLRLLDPNGKIIHHTQTMLLTDGNLAAIEATSPGAAPDANPQTEVSDTTPIEYSEISKKLSKMPGGLMDGPPRSDGIALDPAVRNVLRNPDQFDPLAFEATDTFRAVARHEKAANFVIVPADDEANDSNPPETLQAVLPEVRRNYRFTTTDGTLLIVPAAPDRARRERTNRVALAQLIAASESKGMASLGDFANFAAQSPELKADRICFRNYALLVAGTSGFTMFDTTLYPGLRFLGRLDATTRGKVARGESIPFSLLPPAALAEFLLSTASQPSAGPADDGPFRGRFNMISNLFGGEQSTDPTDAMPYGVPRNGVLTTEMLSEPAFFPVVEEGKILPFMSCLGLDEMALLRTVESAPNVEVRNQAPQIDRVKLGTRATYRLKFQISPTHATFASFDDNRLPANAPIASMKKLPADVDRQLKARAEAVKGSFFGQMVNMAGSMFGGGGGIPPQ